MQLRVGDTVRVWDDERACWREGEVAAIHDDDVEVTVLNGDHPLHPWQPETITVPLDPAFILVRSAPSSQSP